MWKRRTERLTVYTFSSKFTFQRIHTLQGNIRDAVCPRAIKIESKTHAQRKAQLKKWTQHSDCSSAFHAHIIHLNHFCNVMYNIQCKRRRKKNWGKGKQTKKKKSLFLAIEKQKNYNKCDGHLILSVSAKQNGLLTLRWDTGVLLTTRSSITFSCCDPLRSW